MLLYTCSIPDPALLYSFPHFNLTSKAAWLLSLAINIHSCSRCTTVALMLKAHAYQANTYLQAYTCLPTHTGPTATLAPLSRHVTFLHDSCLGQSGRQVTRKGDWVNVDFICPDVLAVAQMA